MMVVFIDAERAVYGVEPLCQVLPMAPSTYDAVKAQHADPACVCTRHQRDTALVPQIEATWRASTRRYGARSAACGWRAAPWSA
jgi:putative transposase